MKCIEVEKQIDSLLDDDVNSVIKRGVMLHLKECSACEQNYEKLRIASEMLMKPISVSNPQEIDERVMKAFRRHHNKQQEAKETVRWRRALAGFSALPKTSAAIAGLLFLISVAAAFQLGRLTAAEVRVTVTQAERINQPELKIEVEPVASSATSSDGANEASAIKFIKVPVVRERIVSRVVYVSKPLKRGRENNNPSVISERDDFALKSSAQKNEFITEADLKGFRLISDSKARIIKKGKTDEN